MPNNQDGSSFEEWIDSQINDGVFEDKKSFANGTLVGTEVTDNGIVRYRNVLIKNDSRVYSIIIQVKK